MNGMHSALKTLMAAAVTGLSLAMLPAGASAQDASPTADAQTQATPAPEAPAPKIDKAAPQAPDQAGEAAPVNIVAEPATEKTQSADSPAEAGPAPEPARDDKPAAPAETMPVKQAPAASEPETPAAAPVEAVDEPADKKAPAPATPVQNEEPADKPAATPRETVAPEKPAAPAPEETVAPEKPAETRPSTATTLAKRQPLPVAGIDRISLLGSYLAGRVARGLRDHDAAADYFSKALKNDPDSDVLLEQTFVLELARGNWKEATGLAERVIKRDERHRFARMVMGLQAVRRGKFGEAKSQFSRSEQRSPLGKMVSIIVDSWLMHATGQSGQALKNLKQLDRMNWSKFYQDYHTAMIADQAGRFGMSRRIYKRMFEKDPRSLRLMDAYVRHLTASGNGEEALRLLDEHQERNGDHPLVLNLREKVESGAQLDYIAMTPQDGLAELYYGIGDALTGDGGVDLGMIYLQSGLLLRPNLPLASLALAEAYEETQHYDLANRIYDGIDQDSPLWPNAAVRRAFNLNSLDKVDEAKISLDKLISRYPTDITALEAQGNILRSHKRYAEAVGYYSKAIGLLKGREKYHWKYFYSRGVCYERLKQWPKAEDDLQQARKLDQDQPLVLNYLGYSWVDQGIYLKKAMRLIRRAVQLKPDDGYFVDSLGWAHYRLGEFKEAVKELERAVELKPDDPVINDHLGDAYWRVNRKLEANFQWKQALTLEPEDAEIPKIKKKLEVGLLDPHNPVKQKMAVAPAAGESKTLKKAVEKAVEKEGGTGGAVKKAPSGAQVPAASDGSQDEEALSGPGKEIGNARMHVVRSGENLWTISKRYYGEGRYNKLLIRANKLRNNNGAPRLMPGMKLIIPQIDGQ